MALFQITNQTVSSNLKASWFTGNSRSNLKIALSPQPKSIPLCTNFFSNNANACDNRKPNDRFSAHSLIKSSKLDSVSNNNNQPDLFANFTGSYGTKISLAKHYKPIKN
jgi:hypothetical protein